MIQLKVFKQNKGFVPNDPAMTRLITKIKNFMLKQNLVSY